MGHTHTSVQVHVIFATKNRRPTIAESFRPRLWEYMQGVARKEFGQALCIGGTENHVHSLIELRADVSLADAMRKWKTLSSRWVHGTFPESANFAWQRGYGAFSVSGPRKAAVIRYIEAQAEHHKQTPFEDEFVAFLQKYGVAYDPAYLWADAGKGGA